VDSNGDAGTSKHDVHPSHIPPPSTNPNVAKEHSNDHALVAFNPCGILPPRWKKPFQHHLPYYR
jgi:hypothetical protein